jgi:hypothetical protein
MKIPILLTLLIGFTVSFKLNEICKNTQEECKGKYNTFNHYVSECDPVKCHGNQSFKCNRIYCTKDAKSCIDFYNLNRQSYSMVRLPQNNNRHSLFLSKIKSCALKEYKLKQQDVCMVGKKCTLFRSENTKHYRASSKIQITCPCMGKYNFHCGKNYCTINDIACGQLLLTKSFNKMFFTKCSIDKEMIEAF